MDHSRHMNLFNVSQLGVTLIGAGGIGAATAVTLGKMGVHTLALYDFDSVNAENLATQLHRLSDVGKSKVEAVKDLVGAFSDDTRVWPHEEAVDEYTSLPFSIIISAVDSIQARKSIWAAVGNSACEWYLDARMGAEVFQLHTVRREDRGWYDALITEEQEELVPALPCSAKATIFCGFAAAALIGKTLRQIATGLRPPRKLVVDLVHDHMLAIREMELFP